MRSGAELRGRRRLERCARCRILGETACKHTANTCAAVSGFAGPWETGHAARATVASPCARRRRRRGAAGGAPAGGASAYPRGESWRGTVALALMSTSAVRRWIRPCLVFCARRRPAGARRCGGPKALLTPAARRAAARISPDAPPRVTRARCGVTPRPTPPRGGVPHPGGAPGRPSTVVSPRPVPLRHHRDGQRGVAAAARRESLPHSVGFAPGSSSDAPLAITMVP